MSKLRLISLNGSPRYPSRTETVATAIGRAIAAAASVDWRHLTMTEIAPDILSGLTRDQINQRGVDIIEAVEAADILVVATPVYRASFTGLLKHLFDLIHFDALRGRIGVLAATGGTPLHGLVTEHQLRPLMSFFGVHTIPTTIYADDRDFDGFEISNPAIHQRIKLVARDVSRLLDTSSNPTHQALAAS